NSQHYGKTLREVPVSYLDWLVGQSWIEPHSFFGRMARLYLGRLVDGLLLPLLEEPFDSRGFIPCQRLGGSRIVSVSIRDSGVVLKRPQDARPWWEVPEVIHRKPSAWSQHRPRQQVEAEDEALNQVWWSSRGQLLMWSDGLALETMNVLRDRQDRKRV